MKVGATLPKVDINRMKVEANRVKVDATLPKNAANRVKVGVNRTKVGATLPKVILNRTKVEASFVYNCVYSITVVRLNHYFSPR